MKKIMLLGGVASLLLSGRAFAGDISISIGFAAPPPLVVVSPGVQIVEDNDDEIFFSNGYYWVERDGGWYRTRDYRGHWIVVERTRVPVFIVSHERGHYKHWKHEEHEERKEERHEEKREEKHEEKHEKHEGGGKKHGKH